MRKLTKQTIRPVISYVKANVNSGYYKFYHFTLDTYGEHNSFKGGTAYTLKDCYATDGKPFDKYALNLETGVILDLENYTPREIFKISFKG